MGKKEKLSSAFDNMLAQPEKAEPEDVAAPAPKKKQEYEVFAFRIERETADLIKDYAYTKRITIKEALTEMVNFFIDDYYSDPDNEPLLKHRERT